MDLSITSSNALSDRYASSGSRSGDAEKPVAATSGSSESAENRRAENLTQRPTREPQQTSRLTPEEQQQLSELQQRDREVKAHELAHKAVGGRYVTGGSFTYQTGPNGQRYAIGGEVSIDSSAGSTPQETLRKAELIRRAALAPADPSPQDFRVASEASMMAAQARSEISAEQRMEAIQARENRQMQQEEEAAAGEESVSPRQNQRALASFAAFSGLSTLRSNPDPIDELV